MCMELEGIQSDLLKLYIYQINSLLDSNRGCITVPAPPNTATITERDLPASFQAVNLSRGPESAQYLSEAAHHISQCPL